MFKHVCKEVVYSLVVLPGGYIVVTMRHEHLETVDEYKQNMRPTINQLTSENKWKVVKDQRFPNWCYGKDGQGIDGHLFVFHKD